MPELTVLRLESFHDENGPWFLAVLGCPDYLEDWVAIPLDPFPRDESDVYTGRLQFIGRIP